MKIDEFRKAVREEQQLHVNDDYNAEKYYITALVILTENIEETIAFLDYECTASEFSWLSSIFEEIAERTRSKDFIECLWRVAKKFPEECETYNVHAFIRDAEELLE